MCDPLRLPDGTVAIVCGVRKKRPPPCVHCGQPSVVECDGPPLVGTRGTCDRSLCRRCGIHVPPNFDFCKDHRLQAMTAAGQLRLFKQEKTTTHDDDDDGLPRPR